MAILDLIGRARQSLGQAFDDYTQAYLGPEGAAFLPTKTEYDIAVNRAAARVPSQALEGTFPGILGQTLGTASDIVMPALALGSSPFYDLTQAASRARAKYGEPDVRSVVDDAEIPIGPSLPEYARAVADENILRSAIGRTAGAGENLADRFGKIAGGIKDLNLGFTSAAAAEPPSSQKFSQQFSVTQTPQFDFKGAQLFDPSNIMRGSVVEDVVDTPTREFGTIRAGQPELGIFASPAVQDVPIDLSELDYRETSEEEDAEAAALLEQAQQEERRSGLDILRSFGKDVGSRALISNILQGAGTVIGGPVVGTVAGITGLLRGPDILNQINRPGTPGFGVSRPGNTLTPQTIANRSQFDDFYSGFRGGAQNQMGRRVDDVINRTVSGRRTRSDASDFVSKYGSKEQKSRFEGIQKDKENVKQNPFDTTEGQGGGGGKIVCTMMNESYGFGNFRNKIWLRQSKDLAPEYQKGYHILFLPLVKIAKTNKIVKKVLEHIAVHRTIDIRQESRGKTHMLGRLYRKVLEPICYWVGKYAKR